MNSTLKLLTYLSAIFGSILFLRPRDTSVNTLLWFPKMISGGLSPILGISGIMGALLGLIRRDWKLTSAGLLGAGFAAKFIADLPASDDQFTEAFGPEWQARLKSDLQGSAVMGRPLIPQGEFEFQQDLVIGSKPESGKPFLVEPVRLFRGSGIRSPAI